MMSPQKRQLLRKRVLKAVDAPKPEPLWRSLDRRGYVDLALDDGDPYSPDDLIDDAREFAEDQRDTLHDMGQATIESVAGSQQSQELPDEESDLRPYELKRALAESTFFAAEAALRGGVRRFRSRLLGGKLLMPQEAAKLMASPAAAILMPQHFERRGIPLVAHEAEIADESRDGERRSTTVFVSPPGVRLTARWTSRRTLYYADENGETKTVSVLHNSVLGQLLKATERLTKCYPWSEAQAALYLLTGEFPKTPPITGRLKTGPDAAIVLEVRPYVSADTVRNFYLQMQRHAPQRSKQETAKGAAVLWFVLEKTRGGDPTGRWPELQECWNAAHPDQRYVDRGGLRKTYQRAYERIIAPLQRSLLGGSARLPRRGMVREKVLPDSG